MAGYIFGSPPASTVWAKKLEASYLTTELARQIVEEEAEVAAKISYIKRVVDYAKDAVTIEDANTLRGFMLNPETNKYFKGATYSPHDETYKKAAEKNTILQLAGISSYVAASGLVFAHSFLESVLETLLQMTRLCDEASWLPFLNTKTVTIAEAQTGLDEAINNKLDVYIEKLTKESVPIKINRLESLLRCDFTTSNILNYSYDPDRLNEIDGLRHDLAHRRKKYYSIEQAESDITFLYRSAFHFLELVVQKFDIYGAERPKA